MDSFPLSVCVERGARISQSVIRSASPPPVIGQPASPQNYGKLMVESTRNGKVGKKKKAHPSTILVSRGMDVNGLREQRKKWGHQSDQTNQKSIPSLLTRLAAGNIVVTYCTHQDACHSGRGRLLEPPFPKCAGGVCVCMHVAGFTG